MESKKVALVTGANKGLGFETSRQLAQKNIKVIMGSRDIKKGEKSSDILKNDNLDVEAIELDITKPDQIKNAVKYIEEQYGKLDILVNNAGKAHPDEPIFGNSVESISISAIKEVFDVNFYGQIEITKALLPLIKKSDSGRIVNVSSIIGSLTIQSDFSSDMSGAKPFAYASSKTALNQFTLHLAHALKDTNVKVNSAHPGWVKTDMGTEHAPMETFDGVKTAVMLATIDNNGPTGKFYHFENELPW